MLNSTDAHAEEILNGEYWVLEGGVKTELYKEGEVVVYVYAFKLTVQTGELMFLS